MKTAMIVLILSLCCWACHPGTAQDASPHPLKIGERLPEMQLSPLINYKDSSIRLGDSRGKLLILDFWDSWCGACIEAMPHLGALQKQFGDSLQVIAVTEQPAKVIRAFLKAHPRLAAMPFPFLTDDSLLSKYFPHSMVPHEAWIGPEGKVLAITESDQLSVAHIREAFEGETVELLPKRDRLDYDPAKPLFEGGNGGSIDELQYRSEIGGYLDGLPAQVGISDYGGGKRALATNESVLALYKLAYKDLWLLPPNRIRLELNDPGHYRFNAREADWQDWKRQYSYCYELILPPGDSALLGDYVRQDLDRFFGLKSSMDSEMADCWLLEKSGGQVIPSAGGRADNNLYLDSDDKYIRNEPLSLLLSYLDKQPGSLPIVDESGYQGNIDLQFKGGDEAFAHARAALAKQGLVLRRARRRLRIFRLSKAADKQPDNNSTHH